MGPCTQMSSAKTMPTSMPASMPRSQRGPLVHRQPMAAMKAAVKASMATQAVGTCR
jgi:hypothetical protein